jgi:predicted ArsR family transcriptional regulator
MPGSEPQPPLDPSFTDPRALAEVSGAEGRFVGELSSIQIAPGTARTPSSLRRDILLRLRIDGPSSPDRLALQVGASRTGVLQQLRALESAALVTHQTVRHGVGRPRHLYAITPDAQELFPSNYGGLAVGILAAVRSLGGEDLIDELFAARRRQIGERIHARFVARVGPEAPIAERARELAIIQDEQGYLCESMIDADGTIRLREYNCAIYHVARENAAACRAELQLFRDVLGVQVVRESHIASGDRCCSYRVLGPDAAD